MTKERNEFACRDIERCRGYSKGRRCIVTYEFHTGISREGERVKKEIKRKSYIYIYMSDILVALALTAHQRQNCC